MLYRMISEFTWHVSTGPEKENLTFSLFAATPGRDIHPRRAVVASASMTCTNFHTSPNAASV